VVQIGEAEAVGKCAPASVTSIQTEQRAKGFAPPAKFSFQFHQRQAGNSHAKTRILSGFFTHTTSVAIASSQSEIVTEQ
jgi:chitodextrinase